MRAILFLLIMIVMSPGKVSSQNPEIQQVKDVIIESYIQGLINAKDFNKAREGIHEGFIIFGHTGNILTKKTRDEWIAQREARTGLPDIEYEIEYIDIEGDAASVKIRMLRGNTLAIDYVFLYKFQEGWRAVSAIDEVRTVLGQTRENTPFSNRTMVDVQINAGIINDNETELPIPHCLTKY